MKVYERLAQLLDAEHRSTLNGNEEWAERHRQKIKEIATYNFPRGSGFDLEPSIDREETFRDEAIVIYVDFHAMDEHGGYAGWMQTRLEISPTFTGIEIDSEINEIESAISDLESLGVDTADLLYHIEETYNHALNAPMREVFSCSVGRGITRYGKTVAYVERMENLRPHDADQLAARIVRLLNENLTPHEIEHGIKTVNL